MSVRKLWFRSHGGKRYHYVPAYYGLGGNVAICGLGAYFLKRTEQLNPPENTCKNCLRRVEVSDSPDKFKEKGKLKEVSHDNSG